MTQFDKIKKQMSHLYRLDRDSVQFTAISSWCSDRITWAYKFKKITYEEMSELTTAMVNILEGRY